MRAIQRLRNLIRYLSPDSATVQLSAPDFSMGSSREMTMADMEKAVPGLFVEN